MTFALGAERSGSALKTILTQDVARQRTAMAWSAHTPGFRCMRAMAPCMTATQKCLIRQVHQGRAPTR